MFQSRAVTRALHDEHLATIGLLNRMEDQVSGRRGMSVADAGDGETGRLLRDIVAATAGEMQAHFAFEEGSLFPRLDEIGDSGMSLLLAEEHEVLRQVAARLAATIKTAQADGFTARSWSDFRDLCGEFVERMIAHIQKEEMGLLPVLDDVLDDATDADLAAAYAMNR